jgi:hypothetical protein
MTEDSAWRMDIRQYTCMISCRDTHNIRAWHRAGTLTTHTCVISCRDTHSIHVHDIVQGHSQHTLAWYCAGTLTAYTCISCRDTHNIHVRDIVQGHSQHTRAWYCAGTLTAYTCMTLCRDTHNVKCLSLALSTHGSNLLFGLGTEHLCKRALAQWEKRRTEDEGVRVRYVEVNNEKISLLPYLKQKGRNTRSPRARSLLCVSSFWSPWPISVKGRRPTSPSVFQFNTADTRTCHVRTTTTVRPRNDTRWYTLLLTFLSYNGHREGCGDA